jgi:YidC/Oxa1 family membrane protein insertase
MFVVGMFLYNIWKQEQMKNQPQQEINKETKEPIFSDVPELTKANIEKMARRANTKKKELNSKGSEVINVCTDVMRLKIAKTGGDIVFLELLKYPSSLQQKNQGVVLLDSTDSRNYRVQSGLLSSSGPDSRAKRAIYEAEQKEYIMTTEPLVVDLLYKTKGGVRIIKRFSFAKNSYVIKVEYIVQNEGSHTYKANFYGRLRRNAPDKKMESGIASRTYTGGAISTTNTKYKKISFSDMEKKSFKQSVDKGWVAMVEHYFTTVWLPEEGHYQFLTETFADHTFSIGWISSSIKVNPGKNMVVGASLYAGPEIIQVLEKLSPGLDLTVDYGVLWWICQPIFHLMCWLHSLFGNWGIAIILVTVLIKLAFYKLSASSYRSMGNMKKLQPKMEQLKERYGDDRQKFGQAVMELYKKEKVNPLGGCLPVLVQIPVFIALYYVLLESVELRQAPFALWIQDLSAKDPFYVLPIIMGGSMFLQQKMSPAPPDPVQAKVMLAMPIVFTVMFLQFPSGLVLYWVVNNVLSILQQWFITRRINEVTIAKK